MQINKHLLISILSFLLSIFFEFLSYNVAFIFFLVSVFFLFKFTSLNNYFQLVWVSSFSIFSLSPLIILTLLDKEVYLEVFHFSLLCTLITAFLTKDLVFTLPSHSSDVSSLPLYFFIALLTVPLVIISGPVVYFSISGLLIFLIYKNASMNKGTLLFLAFFYLLNFITYVTFVWDGFGRLLLFGYLLPIFLIFIARFKLPFIKVTLFVLLPFSSILASFIRFKEATIQDILNFAMQDSVIAPYNMVKEIIDNFDNNEFSGFYGIVEQFFATFLFFIPRFIWEDKPYVFGFQYTINHGSQSLIDAGHSYAGYFFGENLYYLGAWGYLLSLIYLLLFVYLFRFLHFRFGISISVVFLMWVMTFYWGGFGTFFQRLMFSFPFIVFFNLFIKSLLLRNNKGI